MIFKYAEDTEYNYLLKMDIHISSDMLRNKIINREIILAYEDDIVVEYLRFNYFWDEIPFINMLYIESEYRNKKIGTNLVKFWEKEMIKEKYNKVMTSSLSNENAQHFYRNLGYKDVGSLLLEEALEIIFIKKLI